MLRVSTSAGYLVHKAQTWSTFRRLTSPFSRDSVKQNRVIPQTQILFRCRSGFEMAFIKFEEYDLNTLYTSWSYICSPSTTTIKLHWKLITTMFPMFFTHSLREPCPQCAAPYGYYNLMPLSVDTHRFTVSLFWKRKKQKSTPSYTFKSWLISSWHRKGPQIDIPASLTFCVRYWFWPL